MKIAFLGTHGVGKTTLCFDVAARLKRLDLAVDLVKEVARACPLPITRDTTLEAQEWILHTQIAQEIAASARYQVVVCDRSALDNYAYLVQQVGRRAGLDALVREWMGTYQGLFKVPILATPSFDGTRDTSAQFQADVDRVIDELLAAFELPCVRLDPADRDGWVDAVLRAVGLPAKPPQMDIFAGS
ncbi:MAG: ATP-binding protein [Gemmatimonadetes bacterium]|nr:ATP-binding protein [Gemmatimonadota bacterium]